ncbi:hypothetical protein GW17_00049089 [Ensete ventricosum]|nr:hypothetical protein GW17_00049089 [Ensete ventricosum]
MTPPKVKLVGGFVPFFSIPLPRRGAGAFIVGAVDHSYLITLLHLWLTMSPSTVRALAPPVYPAGYLRRVGHVGGPAVRGCDDLAARSTFVISFFPSREDLLEAPDEGAEDEVLCLTAARELHCSKSRSTEHELGNCDVARVDPTEHELGNYDVARVDPTEQELGNCNVARVDPTEHELGNCNVARVDPTEHELGNCDVVRVDPTEHELGNCDVARVDPTEQELGNCNVARVDPIEQELGNCDVGLLPRVKSGANPKAWPRGRTRAQIRRFGREGELGRKSGDLAERANSGANPEIWPRG